jgi:flagellar biosynthesis protein FlhA
MTSPTPAVRKRAGASQLAVPILMISVVIMMVVPLPPALLDILLAANLATALVVLLTAMMVKTPLDFSVFPALLLVTTLARLALNVSSTRLVLLHGFAGHVIEAFGKFVVGGNLIVGLVIFLILVVIQFTVITAGAGRVAEVSARFTLDAMPGKQMAIDADLNAGLISDSEAKQRRIEVAREADFFGAMDGASKFIKGDAMASIIITAINLVGGFLIGVVQKHESMADAINHYSLLSVGDGLVSQIPALLISVASGIVVTRVQTDDDGGLGADVVAQLTRSARTLRIAAFAVAGLGLLPGLPKLPFIAIAVLLFIFAARRATTIKAEEEAAALPAAAAEEPASDSPEALLETLRVEPLELELAVDLLDLLDTGSGGSLMDRVRALRKRVAGELGVVVPPIRTRDNVTLPSATYVVKLHGVEVARGEAPAGHALVLGDGAGAGLGMTGRATIDPVFGLPATWIPAHVADVLAADGATVIDRASVIVTHVSEVVRRSAADLLSRQDVAVLVEAVKQNAPAVAAEIGGEGLSLSDVQRVLRDLLAEGVPIRDLTRILEAITSVPRTGRSVEAMVEGARVALGAQVCSSAAQGGRLPVLTFDPMLEQSLLEALRPGDNGSWLAIDPARREALLEGIGTSVLTAEDSGLRPAIVCAAQLRPAVRRLVTTARPDLRVISYAELSKSVTVDPVGVVKLAQRAAV